LHKRGEDDEEAALRQGGYTQRSGGLLRILMRTSPTTPITSPLAWSHRRDTAILLAVRFDTPRFSADIIMSIGSRRSHLEDRINVLRSTLTLFSGVKTELTNQLYFVVRRV
jgi:hypothetical protein